jgi:Protein of unknown function (DUF3108)
MIQSLRHPSGTWLFRTVSAPRSLLQAVALFPALVLCAHPWPPAVQAQVASVTAVPASRIIPPPPSFRFLEGRRFLYSVQWHLLNAGTATILIQRSNTAEHLRSAADTSGVVNKIFPVHDTFDADIDPRTFCTLQTSKHSEEGSRRLDRQVHFDYLRTKSQVDERDLRTGNQRHAEFDIPSCVTDVVSGFFYASSLDFEAVHPQMFPVNEHGKTSDIKIEVDGRSKIKVPFGEFETVRIKAEPVSGPLQGKGLVWVWFTDDARRIPVQMKSKLGFANLQFQLQRIDTVAP